MNKVISARELRSASARVEESLLAQSAWTGGDRHDFSPEFHRRMRPVLEKARRQELGRRALQTVAAAFAVVLLCALSWLATHAEARNAVKRWVRETWRNSVVYRFSGENASALPEYRPTWLPEGYAETEVFRQADLYSVTYQNPDGDCIFFHVLQMHEGMIAGMIPAADEMYSLEQVKIGGLPGELHIPYDSMEQRDLIWLDEEHAVAFLLGASLDPSIILHIAESVSLVKSLK